MAAPILQALSFTNAVSATTYDFVPNDAQRVTAFRPVRVARGDQRAQMQAHGWIPRRTVYGGLELSHEGLVKGADADAIIAERGTMLDAILGDLTAAIAVEAAFKVGTLTFRLAGWDEDATLDVALGSYEAPLDIAVVRTAPYQFQWLGFSPVAIGVDSGDPKPI